jgi:isoleucyl-tRNA synthetase
MFIMADGLARLLAPILPVTAEEMWRHLPTGTRESSVHMALFPDAAALEGWRDAALVTKWERLIAIRDAVNRELEAARQAKTIGNSLGAQVILRTGGADLELLRAQVDDLAMLFIVSGVSLEESSGDLEVRVERAAGGKCPRCWRTVPLTAEGICERCTTALQKTA